MNKKNGWFIAAGVISIIDAVIMGILTLVFIGSAIGFAAVQDSSSSTFQQVMEQGSVPPEALQYSMGMLIFLVILFLLFTVVSIVCSVIYLKNSGRSYEETHKHSGSVITAIVFSFLCCGWLVGLFGILGYVIKPAVPFQQTDNVAAVKNEPVQEKKGSSDDAIKKLENLKRLYDQGLISEEEFKEKKKSYLETL